MKYLTWAVRLQFGAWMVVNGLNHFLKLWPQPMGQVPISQELIRALIDSHLFDLVKAVEVVAGFSIMLGIHVPLMVVVCMPVSFVVFYWGGPIEGMRSKQGMIVILCNLYMALAYIESYRAMLTVQAKPRALSWPFRAPAQAKPTPAE